MHSLTPSERAGVSSVRQTLTCSLCVKLLNDPHCLDCKHNFCRLCIHEYARDSQHLGCPKCRLPIYPSEIIRNHSLQNLLQAWQCVERSMENCIQDIEEDDTTAICSSLQSETTLLMTQELQELHKLVDEKAAFIQNFNDLSLPEVHSPSSVERDSIQVPVVPSTEDIVGDSEKPLSMVGETQECSAAVIETTHTCPKTYVLATSSLSKTQKSTVKQACEALGGDLKHKLEGGKESLSISSSVTHLITTSKSEALSTTQIVRRCKRTAKYMMALAHGTFIVDFAWIVASLAAAQWVDEENYEIAGDIHSQVMGKPSESRLNRLQTGQKSDLFSLFQFVLLFRLEDYEYQVDSLRAVVSAFDGHMTPEAHLMALDTGGSIRRTCVGIVPRGTSAQSAREKYHQYHIPIVQIAWIVDCISHLEILPFGEYFPY